MGTDKEESNEAAAEFAASILSGIFKKEEVKEAIKEDTKNLKDTGGPAFPSMIAPSPEHGYNLLGMNLRDWFAGMILNGFLSASSGTSDKGTWETFIKNIPKGAYEIADAMIAERNKK